jgi:hypothetical protein
MNCQNVEFSPEKSAERIGRALQVFPERLLMRVMAFALHLMGARRSAVASLVEMPEESVKTAVRVVLRDGFAALRDRRESQANSVSAPAPVAPITVSADANALVVDFGGRGRLDMSTAHSVQARTVVLSLVNAGVVSVPQAAAALGLSGTHCRQLAHKLARLDVVEALVDKRAGQKRDYRVGPEHIAEIIQQVVARTVTGHSTSSEVVAQQVNARTPTPVSARTVRWHMRKLRLNHITRTLPELIAALKKTPNAGA